MLSYFEIGVDIFGNDVFGFGFVLTIDDVHVQFALGTFEQRAQIAYILAAFLNGL